MSILAGISARSTGRFSNFLFVAVLCASSPGGLAAKKAPAAKSLALEASTALMLAPQGARNPTVAVDARSGTVYLAWAQELPGPADEPGKPADPGEKADPVLQAQVARSDDGGKSFGPPVPANPPGDRIESTTVSPTQVAVGARGEVYVLYRHHGAVPSTWYQGAGWYAGRRLPHLVRSGDGGKTFSAPVEIGGEAAEGLATTAGMLNLFAAPNGDLYASWLDYRELMAYLIARQKEPPKGEEPPTQLRVARSADGGRSFAQSVLVAKPTCVCCGTKVAQGLSGPLYATTRGASRELKGSADAVRDHFVAVSRDQGASWSKPVKFHDDRFEISTCPDITPGLAVDSKGRLHAAWYTGTERHPGVLYARSDDQGRSFSKPLLLLTDDWVPYADVKLALDAEDHAWVAFEDRRGERDLIRLARIAPDGRIARAQPWPGTAPDVATSGTTAIVTWATQAAEGETPGGAIGRLLATPGKPR